MKQERFLIRELPLDRMVSGVMRRIADIPHAIQWHLPSPFVKKNHDRIYRYSNHHAGQRCFIMANGPSLAAMDLSPLAHEITFGLNRIYLLFDRLPFRPTYYVCINELVLEQFAHEIHALDMPKFLNWNQRGVFGWTDEMTQYLRLSLRLRDRFVRAFNDSFSSGGTVTNVAIQLAYLMGFTEVILIGLDHSFADKGTPNQVETRRSEIDVNHFHPDYFPKGTKWQLPDLRRSEIAYEVARNVFEQAGRRIMDATVHGKCTVFEKVDYHSLF